MLKLKDIMSSEIVTVSPRATLRDAVELLKRHHVSAMPVLADDGIVGLITAFDILAFTASAGPTASTPEARAAREDWNESFLGDVALRAAVPVDEAAELLALVGEPVRETRPIAPGALDEHRVEEAMTRKVWGLESDADVTLAAQVMARNRLHRVIVVANGRPVGVVSTSDITRALADGRT